MTQTQTKTENADSWWEEDGPIPMDPMDMEPTGITVRQPQGAQLATRSEYAELSELALALGPRDPGRLLQDAKRVGALLGAKAYYDFPAGGGRVIGPSIDLMDALAIVWGRIVQRVEIVQETRERVHLRGRVVDLLTISATERDYVSAIAPAPGKFADKPDQVERWRVMQIGSASSKAVRGALEHALPAWLVDAAMDAARAASSHRATGGRPLPEARAHSVRAFEEFGLGRDVLEAVVDQPMDLWTADELGMLRELYRRLKHGETAPEAVLSQAQMKTAAAQPQQSQDRLGSLGLNKPKTSSSPSPASGEDQARERPTTKPSRDVGTQAAALRERLRKRLDAGQSVWPDEVKTAIKGALGTSRISLDTIASIVDYGDGDRGWWTVTVQRSSEGEITGYGLDPVGDDEPLGEEPEPQRTSTPWDKLVGSALEAAFGAVTARVDVAQLEQACAEAGVTDPEAELTEDQQRAIGRALEAL